MIQYTMTVLKDWKAAQAVTIAHILTASQFVVGFVLCIIGYPFGTALTAAIYRVVISIAEVVSDIIKKNIYQIKYMEQQYNTQRQARIMIMINAITNEK